MTRASVPKIRALECPNCGGTVELRGHGHAVNAACVHCGSILDARTPGLDIIQRFERQQRKPPLIPLGSRGELQGTAWEAIGFQVRQIEVEGVAYEWSEYLLYNPYRGYRYLTEYHGHWNFVRPLRVLPVVAGRKATLGDKACKHFQKAVAKTVSVMGEFPWQVRVGESATVNDYVCPPHVLSSEETADEVVWSVGEYTKGADIWRAFRLPGRPPAAEGVYANQPSRYTGRIRSMWATFALLFGLLVVLAGVIGLAGRGTQAFTQAYTFSTAPKGEPAFVTPVFELPEGNVEVTIDTDLDNDWAYFSMALINEGTGNALDFGRELSYYHGRDSDGDWTEGARLERRLLPVVPAGRYYLRVEPDMDDDGRLHRVNYTITVRSGVMHGFWLIPTLFLLPVPPLWRTWRAMQFEFRRWAESDYGSMFSSSSSGGDD
jgi:hypothetical protein